MSNDSFERYVNREIRQIAVSMITRYSASVNSVHYFSVLPYGLNDAAVNKTYLGLSKVKGEDYHKIKVTFNEIGGGEDFEDVFVYWIHKETFKMYYLAYSYDEGHGKGYRFREAFNERYVEGIRFLDYNNYKPKSKNVDLIGMDNLFEEDRLELLSKIELKNIEVSF